MKGLSVSAVRSITAEVRSTMAKPVAPARATPGRKADAAEEAREPLYLYGGRLETLWEIKRRGEW